MHYTILIYETPEDFARRTDPDPARRSAYWAEWPPFSKALKEAGVFVGGAGLQPPTTATRLSFREGAERVQDGPYADTKEQLGGYFIIDVPDLAAALGWARRIPHASDRVFEVRPNLVPPG